MVENQQTLFTTTDRSLKLRPAVSSVLIYVKFSCNNLAEKEIGNVRQ